MYIAPEDYHLLVTRAGKLALSKAPPVGGFRPSANSLFESAAQCYGGMAIGAVLTGMGDDGAAGLAALRGAGASTIAQDEASAVVFGMPRAAAAAGGAERVLPLAAIGPADAQAPRTQVPARCGRFSGGSIVELARTRALVLLVDDSPTQALRWAEALENAGFRVRQASNGREALEDALRWRPDVIVSDVLMPVMDGFALCREVRREPALAHVPIVLHTMTFVDPRDEEFALGLGATRFVLKPTLPADLVTEVRAALSATPASISPPASTDEDNAFLQGYNQRLAAKLEEKVAELEDAYHRLEQQSRQNDLILGSVGEGIFGIDPHGQHDVRQPRRRADGWAYR